MRRNYPTRSYDGVINTKMLDIVRDRYKDKFSYGWKANNKNADDQGHWNVPICIQDKKSQIDLTPTLFQIDKELHTIWQYTRKHLIGHRKLSRVYINGYTYGTDGYIHRDDALYNEMKDESPYSETVIFYINEKWDANWGGETAVFNSNRDIATAVLPKHGRVLIFDGQLEHASRPLSRSCKDLRQVLVFKTMYDTSPDNNLDRIYPMTIDHAHSGRTFYEHLVGTHALLLQHGADIDTANAGLFHSIYGTEFYNYKGPKIDRETVKHWIGPQAELMVYTFCNTKDRFSTFVKAYEGIPSNFNRNMLLIEYCNLLEQRGNTPRTDVIRQLIFK